MTWIPINRDAGIPLFRQIYTEFRNQILKGKLQIGEQLPSTRDLAASLQVSRTVIVEAYEQLLAEGYIEGRHGSGTFVAEGTLMNINKGKHVPQFTPSAASTASREEAVQATHDLIDFRHGIPALDHFPRKQWSELSKRACMEAPNEAFGYGKPEGRLELRTIIAQYLHRTRGVICDPDQLLITTGATQALSLIAKLLLSEISDVILEDPITMEIHNIFSLPDTTIHPVPVDRHGLLTELMPENIKPKFIYVTPSHQFPLGGVLPIQRRVQLIQYAAAHGSYIVEDDYDSEFRYEGPPVSSLQGLNPDRVIYIGTFSKILSPALRMGYIILPRAHIEAARSLKWLTDLHTPALEQLTLARFMEEGYLDRHIKQMRKLYRKRRDFLMHALSQSFGEQVTIIGDSTGLHLVAEFAGITFTPDLLHQLELSGVKVHPVDIHALHKDKHRQQIILGFGNLTENRISEGIRRIFNTLSQI
ncbi:MocR-like pyridoxine biosynthesis transcription factor PdxR [Paenibacillus pini]|uniref:Transcriptional regulator n=1 Tax=Paenibacillus pini JCM 16418 TaxID=1236976 RepID=W7YL06_9BACL|nr:PLP-dependent aminotransferase family protein [Paenibacillus pini]GAF08403.1 transcriptional regulator [Paenibacillus pini JCM 16418]